MIVTFVAGSVARMGMDGGGGGGRDETHHTTIAQDEDVGVVHGVLLDPFCGHGSLLAAANAAGLDCIGIELSAKRARKATKIRLVQVAMPGGSSSRQTHPSFLFEGDRLQRDAEAERTP